MKQRKNRPGKLTFDDVTMRVRRPVPRVRWPTAFALFTLGVMLSVGLGMLARERQAMATPSGHNASAQVVSVDDLSAVTFRAYR
jgi:hypothetical protein